MERVASSLDKLAVSKSTRAGSGAAVVEEMQRPGGSIEVVRMSILTSS